jgi:hypothetical protein
MVTIGREHGELRQLALHFEHRQGFVKLVVTHRHGLVAHQFNFSGKK